MSGVPTNSFKSSRGLRQGCPWPPLLFVLFVEGFSRMFEKESLEGRREGIKIYIVTRITHLLFVDDAILFRRGTLREWQDFKDLLDKFYEATCIRASDSKSCFIKCGVEEHSLDQIKNLFPFKIDYRDTSIKYLGNYLKPNNYLKENWIWLVKKVEKGIGNWCYKRLPLGGRLILVKVVLEKTPVYWLKKIPRIELDKIRQL